MKEIRKETTEAEELRNIILAVYDGKPLPQGMNLSGLSIQDGCLLKGIRVAIPKPLRRQILEELHEAHTGIVNMEALARSFVLWPHIDKHIEYMAR